MSQLERIAYKLAVLSGLVGDMHPGSGSIIVFNHPEKQKAVDELEADGLLVRTNPAINYSFRSYMVTPKGWNWATEKKCLQ